MLATTGLHATVPPVLLLPCLPSPPPILASQHWAFLSLPWTFSCLSPCTCFVLHVPSHICPSGGSRTPLPVPQYPQGNTHTQAQLITLGIPHPNLLLHLQRSAHTRILGIILDPSRHCTFIATSHTRKEPNAGPSSVAQPQPRVHRTKLATLSAPLPSVSVGFSVLVTPSCSAICSRSRHQMFKKHFGRQTIHLRTP